MVLKMLSNSGEVVHDINASSPQDVARTHSTVHQDGGTSDSTSRDDHLLRHIHRIPRRRAARGPFHRIRGDVARRAAEDDASDLRVGKNLEVGAGSKRVDVGGAGV